MTTNKMEKTMTAKMEEGFRNEQQAKQLAQREIMDGFKNEDRQMVQNGSLTSKEKIRQLELGSASGSTVGSDASTAVGKDTAEPSRDQHQELVFVSMILYAKKDGIQRMGHRLQAMSLPGVHGDRGVECHQGLAPDGT